MLVVNPLWIIILSPILVSIYNTSIERGREIPIANKFAFGLLIISLSFILLKISTFFVNANYKVPFIWILISYGMYSLGELLVSALGIAMIAHFAPRRLYGVMMGSWYLIAISIGSELGGAVANVAAIPKNLADATQILSIYGHAFLKIGIIGVIVSILAFAMAPYIKRLAEL
jgi:POT family proton-dependent oligopeptide transporter